MEKCILGVLILLNGVVLLGQLWPEGAPPFARGVNIAFLAGSLAYFVRAITRPSGKPPSPEGGLR